ncbi:MAG: SAM-dependent methyltransferase [Clostridiales bacterium]|nr:SAM-dependent methyltransferase [Clostridiales bacterium]
MKLTNRMEAILSLCSPVETAADIGCDHGQVAVELVLRGLAKTCIAADISAPSLEKARRRAEEWGLSGKVECRLGDGLSVLRPGEAQTVVLAGMGAPLMAEILQKQMDVARAAERLVLSPNIYPERLRKFLLKNGWRIPREKMIPEEGKYYPVFLAEPGICPSYRPEELLFGRWEQPDAGLLQFLDYKIAQAERIMEEIRRGGADTAGIGERRALYLQYREEMLRKGARK